MARVLSGTVFILSQIVILIVGLAFIAWLYFYLNKGVGNRVDSFNNGRPVTAQPTSLTLEVSSPEDNLLSFSSNMLISGKTGANKQVLITSPQHDMVVTAKNDGNFSADFPLELGVNNINVAVFDDNGDPRTVEKIVYYSKEKL